MARHPTALPDELGEVFTQEEARAAGVSARRLRARDVDRPYRGMLVTRPARHDDGADAVDTAPFARDRAQRAEMLARARLYHRVMVKRACFIGRTGAAIWGLPIDCSGDLEVGVPAPHRAPRRRGIRGRQLAPHLVDVRWVEGLPVASPASIWTMLASELPVRDLVRLGDAIVHVPRDDFARQRPDLRVASIADLRSAMDAGSRSGTAKLREAFEMLRSGSASPLETDYRLDAAAEGLPIPQLDVEIRDRRGKLLGITEVAYPEYKVLVEVEGDQHRTSRQQWIRDIDKYAAYAAMGHEVVRLTSSHIRGRTPSATRIVRDALIRRGWRP